MSLSAFTYRYFTISLAKTTIFVCSCSSEFFNLCIQDGLNKVNGQTSGTVKVQGEGINMLRFRGDIAPVSYTHLDVYKRQILTC